jgi:hypothetical protein
MRMRMPRNAAGYEQCQSKLLRLLDRLVHVRDVSPDYTYYGIPSPWLQVRQGGVCWAGQWCAARHAVAYSYGQSSAQRRQWLAALCQLRNPCVRVARLADQGAAHTAVLPAARGPRGAEAAPRLAARHLQL